MDDSFELSYCHERVEAGDKNYLPLLNALKIAESWIVPEFREADGRATRYRSRYQLISEIAVGSGAVAVVLGLVEIVFPEWHPQGIEFFEFFTAIVCLLSIFSGWYVKPKEQWLLARHQAENLRLLKFRTLTDARLWGEESGQTDQQSKTSFDNVCKEVCHEVGDLQKLTYKDVAERAAHGVVPNVSEIHCPDSCHKALQPIVQYYCDKRLTTQMGYLAAKSAEEEKRGILWARITKLLFFMSFFFILLHIGLDHSNIVNSNLFHNSNLLKKVWGALGDPGKITRAFVIIAVLGPAFVAGIKTYRASREFERNALRHHATLHSLEGLNAEMGKARNLARKFRIARTCELILEFDSSEFMRLLREVEWYG
jgi:hypothetical protein